jgi:glyoxylase-like metal-dependent hydrolase (beta-lactamase superfamily II)
MNFNHEHHFEYAVTESMGPGLARVTARNPGPMTFHGTGTYLLGRKPGLVIDPGPRVDEHRHALEQVLTKGKPTHILVTHRHHDHAGLAKPLSKATGAPVLAFGGATKDPVFELDGESSQNGFSPDLSLAEGDVVEGDDYRLEVVHTPGHTSDHLCFVDHRHRRVFCGDHIMAWSTTVILPPDGHVGRYIESLERLLDYPDYVFWPTHGPPISDPGSWIRELVAHRLEREQQLIDALAGAPRIVDTLVTRVYGDIDPRLAAPARASLMAGISWLLERGLIVRVDTDDQDRPAYQLA